MKNLSIIWLLFAYLFLPVTLNSQCLYFSSYGSGTASGTAGSTITLTTCQWAGEYNTISGIISGGTYKINSSISTDWVTVRSGSPSGPVVFFGPQGSTWVAAISGTHYAHISSSSACGSNTTCRTTSITTITVPGTVSNPCSSISSINCGGNLIFSLSGSGSWNSLGGPFSTPGKEMIISFLAPSTGFYSITITNNNYYVDLFYKSTTCSSSGWTYVDDIGSGTTSNSIFLTAGVNYLFLVDDENTTTSNVTFTIGCPAPAPDPCGPSITTISSCGSAVPFNITAGSGLWNSYGGPYSVPGREKILKFTPSVTGSYNINVSHSSTGWVDLFYKTSTGTSSCSSSGWTYLDDIYTSANVSVSLVAGTTYFFLLDDEDISGSTGSIQINCPCIGSLVDNFYTFTESFTISDNTLGQCDNSMLRPGEDLTYAVSINCSATYTFNTCGGTSWDTYLYLTSSPGTDVIASNDDACGLQSSITAFLNPGTYYLTVEPFSASGGGSFNLNVTTDISSPNFDAIVDGVSCNGNSDGAITLISDHTDLTFSLNGGVSQTSNYFANLAAGEYSITATNCFGISSSEQVLIQEPQPLMVLLDADEILCHGGTTNIFVTAIGGTYPYTGIGNYNVSAGVNEFIVTDANGCTAMAATELIEPSLLTIEAGSDIVTYYGYDPLACATLTEIVNGGTPGYFISWSGGTNTVCPSVTTAYEVTVTDANGCIASDMTTVCVVDVVCFAGSSSIQKVQICHNGKTLCVSESAVEAHLAHGCTLGSCDETSDCSALTTISTIPVNNKSQTSDNHVEQTIQIYPNPSTDLFTLEVHHLENENNFITVYNNLGEILFSQPVIEGGNRLDLSNYPDGIYLIRFGSDIIKVTKI